MHVENMPTDEVNKFLSASAKFLDAISDMLTEGRSLVKLKMKARQLVFSVNISVTLQLKT
jgi:hypothetical protein